MRHIAVIALALACGMGFSCDGGSPEEPPADSNLEVYVHWGDTGLPDKRLELLERKLVKLTDQSGIAEFRVPPGTYTLRAYEINQPGPPPLFIDMRVTTLLGQTTRVEVVDCLPCDAATNDN